MNSHQDVRTNFIKKPIIVKMSLAILFSMMLFSAAVGFHSSNSYAATNGADPTSVIRQVFGGYADQALHIAQCESTMNPGATNTQAIGNSHAAGLFQVLYPSTWITTSQASASPYDVTANVKAAYEIFQRDGYSWREWECHL
ncbi:transglycosylase SLT domain-containing protein [Dictyobacter arantiisoli]|uniref:Transglycosylase SLT domain-containing protein n=1 Tax=Dictyobacter arantiisoli TaxID=2014874 RepID=A0A5A5TDI1_9CHLR|nr:transglycosylase SLT domain-containing protein [Dictyobacter arantiisoli]GCF08914.1 hypothetical protein KDI_24780 [Dictyobacter arantiisoli]